MSVEVNNHKGVAETALLISIEKNLKFKMLTQIDVLFLSDVLSNDLNAMISVVTYHKATIA